MNRNSLFIIALLGASVFVGGCDLSWDQSRAGGGDDFFNPQGPELGDLTACILLNYERIGAGSAEDPLCPGTIIRLNGFNFSDELDDHQILFSAGNGAIQGMPLDVVNRRVDLESSTIESYLEVIVPTGVTNGNIELLCHGLSAGAVGFDACPAIFAVTLGANEDDEYVVYTPLLSRFQENSRVNLYGINLTDVNYLDLDDGGGNSVRVPSSTFIRNQNTGGFTPGSVSSGYDSFSFVLNDGNNGNNNFSFPFALARENLGIVARSNAGSSNRVEIPVANENLIEVIGAAVNGMRGPTGIATGSVRIDYTCYELVIDASYTMEFEWAVENSLGELEWQPAKPRDEDPDNDGKFEITCGTIQHKYPGQRLLPSGGLQRTFVWDAQCDPLFRDLNETVEAGITPQRFWTVHFRVRPIPDAGDRDFSNHAFEASPFIYYWLEDRPEEPVPDWRSGEIVESFDTDTNLDTNETDASWGAPYNPGLLEGKTDTNDVYQFGQGLAQVYLEIQPTENFLDPDTITGQYYVMDTDRLSILHILLRNVALEGEPAVIIEESSSYRLTDDGTVDGNPVDNPGEAFDEFHFATFNVAPQTNVFVEGERPLVIRCSGGGNTASDTDPVFTVMGILDLNGGAGADGSLVGGEGGQGTAGGGDGGDGSLMQLANDSAAAVMLLEPAMAGSNGGGSGGSTPAAVNPDAARNSTFAGAPGGGGGHRERGGDGDYGNTNIANFVTPRVGRGGVVRGNALLTPLTSGSGGGGGGASLSRVSMGAEFAATGGGGGGGGGGSLRLTARGSVVVIGSVQANGGLGGSGRVPPGEAPAGTTNGGAGGGGSGGAVHMRATGSVDLSSCASLQVQGGEAGSGGPSNGQNRIGGAGDGGDGFIRLESGVGGTPFCMTLQASTRLTSTLSGSNNRNQTIRVQSTQAFPSSGFVKIEEEVIGYGGKTANTFTGLSRAVEGTRTSHSSNTEVFIYPSTIEPARDPAVLMNGGFIESPEEPTFGRGRDGVVHLRFIQSLDPDTGEIMVDEATGRPVSVWAFDTETSTLRSPLGNVVKETRESDLNPGFLDLSALIIDEDVVLRATGPNPLTISVKDYAEIAGSIDASGGIGGAIRFTEGGETPLSGLGGVPGAGGGSGGTGGMVTHRDGNPQNRTAANTEVTRGQASGLPNFIVNINRLPPFARPGIPNIDGSTGGASMVGRTCGFDCFESGGGGGGGGNLRAGGDGEVKLLPGNGALEGQLAGQSGDLVNFRDQRLSLPGQQVGLALVGGTGGGGGGASANISRAYRNESILGNYPFKGEALYAPGTGGGGGGGIIHIVAQDMYLRSSARLISRGGDAYQSIDLAGNGGAGAGGTIFLQVQNTITLEPGIQFDVSAGLPNRLPPFFSSGVRLYEGNIRAASTNTLPALVGTPFGGLGGASSNGRIRIEYSPSSRVRSQGVNPSVTTGPFLPDIVESVAVSRIYRIGVGPGRSASSHSLLLDGARVVYNTFQQPPGTRAIVVWESAGESLDVHGQPGELKGLVRDPRKLKGTKYVRFRVFFQSKYGTGETQSIQSLSLPFRLNDAGCLPFGF